ncbi:restriction system modified-DNA reader domain-containing protein [Streptomyces sp. NPDC003943]
MPKRSIEIDDEVFAFLQSQSEPLVDTPNDVLRRLLLGSSGRLPDATSERRPGDLMPFIKAGLLTAGDKLIHVQPRRGLTHETTVTADGWLAIEDGREFPKPSPALKAQTGVDINGYGKYVLKTNPEVRLQDLREQLRGGA